MRFSDAEWRLMTALWNRRSATARDVHDDVAGETGWAYTTVKTMLDRLAAKGALAVDASRTAARYTPRVSQSEGRRSALRTLLDQAFGGAVAPLVAELLGAETLNAADRADLSRLVADATRGKSAAAARAGDGGDERTLAADADAALGGRATAPRGRPGAAARRGRKSDRG